MKRANIEKEKKKKIVNLNHTNGDKNGSIDSISSLELNSKHRNKERGGWNRLDNLSSTLQHYLQDHSMLDREYTINDEKNQESRFSLGMIKDRLTHFAVSTRINKVRNSVNKQKNNGEITFKFAQTKGTFLDQIMKHKDTSGGVCESISAHWISAHAKGKSIFSQLYVDGKKGKFHVDTLFSIKQLQMDGNKSSDQNRTTEDWLIEHGIQPRKGKEKFKEGDTGDKGTHSLIESICNPSGYKKISFFGKMAGHTVAAYVDDHKGITFFDPNFGEFKFPNHDSFINWFTQDFWTKSWYSKEIGLGEEFEVLNYIPEELGAIENA
ncbi:YopT-type cysteine protease domain-containing protein [Xenorhabdus bovienii]|uniref:YopT-type cysteine protease domain-containing protein n=1 Tax=Xenorhabdus bovienii TaxID=40576 RepID=UPI0023B26A56|nr:YopT-type cysteine protease domain-containing protein [Xenorhabdus bovienii]MDE9460886.1 YopT-type cysteine protease domain-containing protein [Xenorhabdus bovienii]MDE9468172.1 YopT-type cysteine protease domain-containing protein [Xenorhabdus bovienii]